jgi:class 3 adenylate cyclase/tetratricopeptide (TPR) repeat protein
MICSRCQTENPPQAKFCLECATPLALRCTNCGTQLPGGAKFCFECATPVGAPGSAPKFSSPENYTPKHLAERIINSKTSLEGERKQVTVLFADLKGSMELLSDRDPEEARKILDPVLEHMMEAVHRYEGTVNQVMGDGIMALFGAPVALESHAVRACYGALRMQETIKKYAEELHQKEGVPIQVRIGLNSGEVVVRSVGSDLHMDYTAVGQTTHLAARMEQMALPGSILISADTLKLAEGYVVVKALGPRPVKGLDAPVEVYEVTSASTLRSRLQATAARGLTRFVGRDTELELLLQALESARSGHGQVVAVVGEAGVGKSRLYWEFTHSHRTEGWLLVESSSVSYGKATAYLPIVDLLKAYFQVEGRDEARKIREKVTGKVLSLDRALEPALPALLSLLDVPAEDPAWERLEPHQRRRQTLDGVKHLLVRESQVQPLVVLFEDLHWIDAETQAFLDGLVESLPNQRIVLLVNYRPEYQPAWGRKTYFREVRISRLPSKSTDELLAAMLGTSPGLETLKRLLIERTEGNPLFLEESVRTLVETGFLDGERGAYRLTKPAHSLRIPATAQAMIAARIDRLAPEHKRALQSAAVIGKDVPFTLLQAIGEQAEPDLRQSLGALQAAEFLYETSLFPELEYTFRHSLTQEVAYRSLPAERRKGYHEKIAMAVEMLFPGRLGEKVELLAHHYHQGGSTEKAMDYLLQAARKAVQRFAAEEASRYYRDLSGILDRLPQTEERERQRIDLRLAEVEMVWARGRYEEGWRLLEESQVIAETLGDLERLARIQFQFGWYSYDRMELDRAYTHYEQCLGLSERLGRLQEMRRVYWGLGQSCRALSADVNERRQRAIEYHRQGLALAERAAAHDFYDVHNAHFLWLIFFFQLGDWDSAMTYLERALAAAKALPQGSDTVHVALMQGSVGLSHLVKRKTETHLGLLRESLRAAEEGGFHIYTTISQYLVAHAYFLLGSLEEALAHFKATLAIAEKTGNLFLPGTLLWTAETEARVGQLDEALKHLDVYDAWRNRCGSLEGLAWFPSMGVAHRVRGLILAQRNLPEEAQAQFQESIRLLEVQGYRPDLARTHLALGDFERRRGRRDEARAALERAATGFRQMDFTLELTEALRLLDATA